MRKGGIDKKLLWCTRQELRVAWIRVVVVQSKRMSGSFGIRFKGRNFGLE